MEFWGDKLEELGSGEDGEAGVCMGVRVGQLFFFFLSKIKSSNKRLASLKAVDSSRLKVTSRRKTPVKSLFSAIIFSSFVILLKLAYVG